MVKTKLPRWVVAAFILATIGLGLAIALSLKLGLLVVGTLMVPLLFRYVHVLVALIGITVPFSASLGVAIGPTFVSACDALALLYLAHVATFVLFRKQSKKSVFSGLLQPLAAISIIASPYFVVAIVNAMIFGYGLGTYLDIMQRFQLTILWAAVGVALYKTNMLSFFLKAFVAATLMLSMVWMINPGAGAVLGVQKNPSGGFIASALLVTLLSSVKQSLKLPLVLLLAGGLVSTGSRGAMLGLAVGLASVVLFSRHWKKILLPGLTAFAAGVIAFKSLPSEVSSRILSENSSGIYNIEIRQIFVQDALGKFEAAPFAGVGVGNYMQTNPLLQRVQTLDPHNVYVLTLAEGGYPLFFAFLIMIFGTLLFVLCKKSQYAALAVPVQISILAHSYVDIYWARGTPIMGWLLIGVAIACVSASKHPKRRYTPVVGTQGDVSVTRSRRIESLC